MMPRSKRSFLPMALIVVAFLWLWCAAAPAAGPSAPRPNILLILTDDQGWGDFRCNGNEKIDTPVLDRLSTQGARFDRFYVSPLCAPTRASLLSGRYHLRGGVHGVTRTFETMRSDELTVAEIFRSNGYATGCFGKWHNGAHFPQHPNGQGFEQFIGFCAGHWNDYHDTMLEHNGRPLATRGFITDALTDSAIAFIEANRDRPFFCYVPYNAPHAPWQAPERLFKKYLGRGVEEKTACAYAMCENLDQNVGRLLGKLDELKLADNTIVVFLTDNGPNTDRYNGNMKGRKGSAQEGGVRVPLFIRYPGRIAPGTLVRPIAAHVDLLPTLVELCGVSKPAGPALDGRSLVGLLGGGVDQWPDERMIFTHQEKLAMNGAVRTQRWRLVGSRRRWELYDMQADPQQARDVAKDNPQVVARLSAAYEASHREVTAAGFEPIATEVGHAGWPLVSLLGHEAMLYPKQGQGISYQGPAGWANDWVANWRSLESYPFWHIDVVRPGRYAVRVMYGCAAGDVGGMLRVEAGGRSLEAKVEKPHDVPNLPNHDLVPRHEVYERSWAPLEMGTMELGKGPTKLVLRALSIAGAKAPDVKAVELRRVDGE